MDDQDELSAFARTLIQRVRDQTIRGCDDLLDEKVGGPFAERWREIVRSEAPAEVVRAVIPDIVDQTLFHLLDAIDNDALPLAFRTGDGSYAPLEELGKGEMGGWLLGSPGWRNEHSGERFFDAFEDLRLE